MQEVCEDSKLQSVYVLYKERNHMLLKHGLSTRTQMKRLLS
jgi:hypothetical protein